jgi:hypothetical protein
MALDTDNIKRPANFQLKGFTGSLKVFTNSNEVSCQSLLYPKTGSHPAIELLPIPMRLAIILQNKVFTQTPKLLTTLHPLSRFMSSNYKVLHKSFLTTTTTTTTKKKLRYLEWLCQRRERSDNM